MVNSVDNRFQVTFGLSLRTMLVEVECELALSSTVHYYQGSQLGKLSDKSRMRVFRLDLAARFLDTLPRQFIQKLSLDRSKTNPTQVNNKAYTGQKQRLQRSTAANARETGQSIRESKPVKKNQQTK